MPGLVRLLLIAGLVYVLVAGLRRLAAVGRNRSGSARGPDADNVPLVQDPHCGRFIPQTEALTASRRGQTIYFCCRECRTAYRAA